MLQAQIIILVVLIFLSAFFSGVETALVSISDIKAKALLKQKRWGSEALYRLKQKPRRMIITILIGNNLVNIGAASLATLVFTELFGSSGVGIATGVMTFLILLFGEITPKSLASMHSERIALIVARPVELLTILLFPLVELFWYMTEFVAKIFKSKNKNNISVDEIKTTLMLGGEEGVISRDAAEIMHNIIEFDKTPVTKIMVPKKDMVLLDGEEKLKDTFEFFVKNKFSRYPVYLKDKDNIIGILDVDDVLKNIHDKDINVQIKEIVRDVMFVSKTKEIDDLLADFEGKDVQVAIVRDEHEFVIGLVGLEDILEEIVGEIFDKSKKESVHIRKINDRLIKADAKASINDINKMFNLKLKEKHFDTIAEYINHRLQRDPQKGDQIKLKHITIEVEKVTKKGTLKTAKIMKN